MLTKEDWLPVGSMVRLKDGERPVMVAGYMAIGGSDGRIWDYVGYPYPVGRMDSRDYFFDKESVEEIYLVGYLDQLGRQFQAFLEEQDEEYQRKKREATDNMSSRGTGAVVSSSVKSSKE